MWITQSYLGTVEPDAELFAYYMYRDYIDEDTTFTERLQSRLEDLGDVFGNKVCLSMPNPRYAGRIEAEVRENRPLWEALHSKLPGLLLATKPLVEIEAYDSSCFYVPFIAADGTPDVDGAVRKLKAIADEAITWNYKSNEKNDAPSIMDRVLDSIELKPGVAGFRIDLRKLTQW